MITTTIIPAGGIGRRFGGNQPKQFLELKEVPVLIRTIQIFEQTPEIDNIVIPVHADWYQKTRELIDKYDLPKVTDIVVGGKNRHDSVYNALQTQTAKESDIILVHDAVRPITSIKLVQKIIEETTENGAVIPALQPKDTIKEKNRAGAIVKTLDRNILCSVQTPQGFWQELIYSAFGKANEIGFQGTDSASLLEFIGYKVKVVDGEENNIKITTPLDLKIAEIIISEEVEV